MYPWFKFFFEVGTLDETSDRKSNDVIDSIDDTISFLIYWLKKYITETKALDF